MQYNSTIARTSIAGPVDPTAVSFAKSPIAAPLSSLNVDPRRFAFLLWSWRWLFVAAAVLAVTIAVIQTYATVPKYAASALLEISPPETRVMAPNGQQESITTRDPQFLTTQLGLLKSVALAERVARELRLLGNADYVQPGSRVDPLASASGTILKNLTVEPVDTGRLVRVRYSDSNPARAAAVANSVVDGFIALNVERRFDASSNARRFLETRIAATKAQLERSERELVDYARAQGIILVDSPAEGGGRGGGGSRSLATESLVDLNRALTAAQNERIAAEEKYRQSTAQNTSSNTADNSGIQALTTQVAGLRATYQQKLERFAPEFPEMVGLKRQIDDLERQISVLRSEVSRSIRGEYLAALGRENELQAKVRTLQTTVLDQRNSGVKYNILQREVDTNRTLYDGLLQRYKEIGVAGGIGTSTASIVDRAKVPGAPYSPDLMLNIGLALIIGLFLATLTVFMIEYIDDTIKTADDVKNALGETVLGVIPLTEKGEDVSSAVKATGSRIGESYATVRATLQFTTASGAPKVILVSSSRAAEGKSSTAFAISINLARLGASVLLIDADMRKPTFRTGVPDQEGLSSLLTGNANIDACCLETENPGLSLLPAGPHPPNPAELLSGTRMGEIIETVSQRYDHIVVDGPPLLGLADSVLLAAICDGVVFVVESNGPRRPQILAALERIRVGGAHVLGVVLTKVRSAAGYGYDYEYYSYGAKSRTNSNISLATE